jgi:hypothetical protein
VNLADAAAAVLSASPDPLDAKEIAARAIERGLISPRTDAPWTYVRAAIRKENRRRAERGEQPRFAVADSGRFQLVTLPR